MRENFKAVKKYQAIFLALYLKKIFDSENRDLFMSEVMYLESHNYNEDNQAAKSIIFEIEKGTSTKIVWFSNLNQIVDHIHYNINQNSLAINTLKKEIVSFEKDIKNITEAMFQLKAVVEKIDRKIKKNHFKLSDVLVVEEDKHGDPLED